MDGVLMLVGRLVQVDAVVQVDVVGSNEQDCGEKGACWKTSRATQIRCSGGVMQQQHCCPAMDVIMCMLNMIDRSTWLHMHV
jgi:hypothetical protein